MRRTLAVALVGVALSVALVSEALADATEPNVTAPAKVKKDEPFSITVRNCQSGGGGYYTEPYTAYILEQGTRPDGTTYESEHTVYPYGDTVLVTKLNQVGTWIIKFICEHRSSGGNSTAWEETITIEVEPASEPVPTVNEPGPTLTQEEKQNCNKKKTRKKRKRCRAREAAD